MEERDKKNEDKLVYEMEDALGSSISAEMRSKIKQHMRDLCGPTDDQAAEEMEEALRRPPHEHFSHLSALKKRLDESNLVPQRFFIAQQDLDDIMKWSGEDNDAGRGSGDSVEEQGLEERLAGEVRLRDDEEQR